MKRNEPEQDQVIHSVDGIEEYDNRLPNWWLYTLYGSIAFAAVYWFAYHVGGYANLPLAAYQIEVDRVEAAQAANAPPVTAESLVLLTKDDATVERGHQVFVQTCAQCHRQDGGGQVGPNLTDEFWLHGAAPDQIWKTISEGVPAKGMPSWGPQLGPRRVQAVTAYVLTLRNKNVPNGKAPQGERVTLSSR